MNVKRLLLSVLIFSGLAKLAFHFTDRLRTDADPLSSEEWEAAKKRVSFQGHRGARGLAPENTLPSFQACFDLGVYAFEFDLVVSKDEQLVLSHEGWMNHLFCSHPDGRAITEEEQMNHLLFQMPYDSIKTYDCGKRGNEKYPEQKAIPSYKPSFKEMVAYCENHSKQNNTPPIHYNIELKSYKDGKDGYGLVNPEPKVFAKLVAKEIKALGIAEQCVVQSFDPNIVRAMKEAAPHLKLSLLVDNTRGLDYNIKSLGFTPDVYAPYFKLISNSTIEKAHKHGMRVVTWTVNEVDDMRRLIRMGVDGIITDYPNRFEQISISEN